MLSFASLRTTLTTLWLLLVPSLLTCCSAFVALTTTPGPHQEPLPHQLIRSHRRATDSMSLSAVSPKTADFEYQELQLQCKAIMSQGITSSTRLPASKRAELLGYIRQVLQRRDSSIPLYEIDASKHLSGTSWRLAFMSASDGSGRGDITSTLPPETQVRLQFTSDKAMKYMLDFTKVFALKRMTASSSYQIDSSPASPGCVYYTYEDITTDLFGFSDLGVGTFGLLKGRTSTIQTKYFDGDMWIDVSTSTVNGPDDTGVETYAVYIREEE